MSPDEQDAILQKAREICSRYAQGITVATPIMLSNGLGVCLHVPNKEAWEGKSLRAINQQIAQIPGVARVLVDI